MLNDLKQGVSAPNLASASSPDARNLLKEKYKNLYREVLARHQDLYSEGTTSLAELETFARDLSAGLQSILNSNPSSDRASLAVFGAEYLLEVTVLGFEARTSKEAPVKSRSSQVNRVASSQPDSEALDVIFHIRSQHTLRIPDGWENSSGILDYGIDRRYILELPKRLSSESRSSIKRNLALWPGSNDPRKLQFLFDVNALISEICERGSVADLENLLNVGILDVNYRGVSDLSILQYASHFNNRAILDWLLTREDFDFLAEDKDGRNEIEQLVQRGMSGTAGYFFLKRPNLKAQGLEASPDSPFVPTSQLLEMKFLQFLPGMFISGSRTKEIEIRVDDNFYRLHQTTLHETLIMDARVLTTISSPFEITSVPVSRDLWVTVRDLYKLRFLERSDNQLKVPEKWSKESDGTKPATDLNLRDVQKWFDWLQELSSSEDKQIQEILFRHLPGHRKGAKYRLPGSDELEYFARLGGLATGDNPFGVGTGILSSEKNITPFNKTSTHVPSVTYGGHTYPAPGSRLFDVSLGTGPDGKLYYFAHGPLRRIKETGNHLFFDRMKLDKDMGGLSFSDVFLNMGFRILRTYD